MEPVVSVIIPVYNAEHYLERCLESIQKQSLRDFELILVDDGSADRSPEICRACGTKTPGPAPPGTPGWTPPGGSTSPLWIRTTLRSLVC